MACNAPAQRTASALFCAPARSWQRVLHAPYSSPPQALDACPRCASNWLRVELQPTPFSRPCYCSYMFEMNRDKETTPDQISPLNLALGSSTGLTSAPAAAEPAPEPAHEPASVRARDAKPAATARHAPPPPAARCMALPRAPAGHAGLPRIACACACFACIPSACRSCHMMRLDLT